MKRDAEETIINRLKRLSEKHGLYIPDIGEFDGMSLDELEVADRITANLVRYHLSSTSGEPLPRGTDKNLAKERMVRRLGSLLLFDTGRVVDDRVVKKMIEVTGFTPEQIARATSYRDLTDLGVTIGMMGPRYTRSRLEINRDGKIIGLDIGRLGNGYIQPEERFVLV